jgi:hypothetical protein
MPVILTMPEDTRMRAMQRNIRLATPASRRRNHDCGLRDLQTDGTVEFRPSSAAGL